MVGRVCAAGGENGSHSLSGSVTNTVPGVLCILNVLRDSRKPGVSRDLTIRSTENGPAPLGTLGTP